MRQLYKSLLKLSVKNAIVEFIMRYHSVPLMCFFVIFALAANIWTLFTSLPESVRKDLCMCGILLD